MPVPYTLTLNFTMIYHPLHLASFHLQLIPLIKRSRIYLLLIIYICNSLHTLHISQHTSSHQNQIIMYTYPFYIITYSTLCVLVYNPVLEKGIYNTYLPLSIKVRNSFAIYVPNYSKCFSYPSYDSITNPPI